MVCSQGIIQCGQHAILVRSHLLRINQKEIGNKEVSAISVIKIIGSGGEDAREQIARWRIDHVTQPDA